MPEAYPSPTVSPRPRTPVTIDQIAAAVAKQLPKSAVEPAQPSPCKPAHKPGARTSEGVLCFGSLLLALLLNVGPAKADPEVGKAAVYAAAGQGALYARARTKLKITRGP